MKCKKHFTDLSSTVGVCASCLRERLFALMLAQAQAQGQSLAQAQAQVQAIEDGHRKSDAHPPPPLAFPRSVSPYISRRKSDNAAAGAAVWPKAHHQHSSSDQRFYGTPQVGPTVGGGFVTYKKRRGRFSLFSGMFRSKHRESDLETDPSVTSSSSSPSWFSNILPGRRKKQQSPSLFYVDESTVVTARKNYGIRNRDRGMSPIGYSEDGGDDDYCCDESSGYSSESSKQTPRRTAAQPARRGGGGRPCTTVRNMSVTGFAFCLSPLVRPSPNRHWNGKGMPPEVSIAGEIRVPVKPHLSNVKAFCANRSRKLADFGRFNPNH